MATTQCFTGGIIFDKYAVGAALAAEGVVSAGDMTTEASDLGTHEAFRFLKRGSRLPSKKIITCERTVCFPAKLKSYAVRRVRVL